MREAEEELLSLEREDSAFSSVPRLTQDSEAAFSPQNAFSRYSPILQYIKPNGLNQVCHEIILLFYFIFPSFIDFSLSHRV